MEINKILEESIPFGVEQLKKDYSSRDFNTTGKLFSSIKQKNNEIVAKRYIFALIYGRKPGHFPPYEENTNLYNWTKIKIKPEEKKIKSVAFLVARKIANEGTRIFKKEIDPLETEMTKEIVKSVFIEKIKNKHKLIIKQQNE